MAVLPPNGSSSSPVRSVAAGLVQLFTLVVCLAQFISISAVAQERERLAIKAVLSAVVDSSHMRAELLSEHSYLVAGRVLPLALRLQPDEGWHTYWVNPGDSGGTIDVKWILPDGDSASDVIYPAPHRIPYPPLMTFGYENQIIFPIDLSLIDLNQDIDITVNINFLICADVCIPESALIKTTLNTINEDVNLL